MMNNTDCGCDGSSTNMDILNRNTGINNTNGNIVNNVRKGNNNTKYINNMNQNQQNINNNANLNGLIAPVNNQFEVNQLNQENKNNNDGKVCKKDIKIFLYILLALSLNEMCKFFINQSIRLNKASSNRYLFYPLLVFVILVITCLC